MRVRLGLGLGLGRVRVMLSRPNSSSSSLLMLPPHRWRRRAPVKTATRAATDFFIGNLISYQWIDKVVLAGYLLLCSRCLGDVVVAARRASHTSPHARARWRVPARSHARALHAGLTSVVDQRPNRGLRRRGGPRRLCPWVACHGQVGGRSSARILLRPGRVRGEHGLAAPRVPAALAPRHGGQDQPSQRAAAADARRRPRRGVRLDRRGAARAAAGLRAGRGGVRLAVQDRGRDPLRPRAR